MLNETASVRTVSGAWITLLLPAYAVGYCILKATREGEQVRMVARCRIEKDESCAAAYDDATRKFPNKGWRRCSGSKNARSTGYAKTDFYSVAVMKDADGNLRLELGGGDGLRAGYLAPINKGEAIKEMPILTEAEVNKLFANPTYKAPINKMDAEPRVSA